MNKLFFLILSCVVAPGSVNAMERYPLHEAAKKGEVDNAIALLNAGVAINQLDEYGCSPLHFAASSGHRAVVQILLDRGANVNQQDSVRILGALGEVGQNTPLLFAATYGHLSVVRLLLERGADINLKNCSGNTPLQIADFARRLYTQGSQQAVIDLLGSWPAMMSAVVAWSKAARLAFCMAMHPRVGVDSSANVFPREIFQEICNYLRPSVLMDDPQAVEYCKRIYEQQQAQQQSQAKSWCVIS